MQILQMSDLHLEFEDFRPTEQADILMLNGDICVADYMDKSEESKYYHKGQSFYNFFSYCTDRYEHVLYVPGNHEYYCGRYDKTVPTLKKTLDFDNLHILDNDCVDINGVRFIGTTLWTSVGNMNPIYTEVLKRCMNDYRMIKYFDGTNYRKLQPYDTASMFARNVKFIDYASMGCDRVVVMSHHAPSHKSVHPKYHNDTAMNTGYYSDLDNFILDHDRIMLWTHGHMHDCFDYSIGHTRVVCNPKGYGHENRFFKPNNIISL